MFNPDSHVSRTGANQNPYPNSETIRLNCLLAACSMAFSRCEFRQVFEA